MRSIGARHASGRILVRLLLTILTLAVVLLTHGLMQRSLQPVVAAAPPLPMEPQAAAQRLAEAIRIRTISYEDPAKIDDKAFERLHALLEESYPFCTNDSSARSSPISVCSTPGPAPTPLCRP